VWELLLLVSSIFSHPNASSPPFFPELCSATFCANCFLDEEMAVPVAWFGMFTVPLMISALTRPVAFREPIVLPDG